MSSPEESEFSSLMKEGDCREAFTEWKSCVDKAKNKDDIVEKCFESGSALTKCMEARDPVPVSDEEEEDECGFCLFMKGGACKDAFVDWDNCYREAKKEGDVTNRCVDLAEALSKCMLAHLDYYEPVLQAEKVMQEEALRESEKKAASEGSDQKTQKR